MKEGKLEPELAFHGIGSAIGVKLKESGFNNAEVAISLGDVPAQMERIYNRGAANRRI